MQRKKKVLLGKIIVYVRIMLLCVVVLCTVDYIRGQVRHVQDGADTYLKAVSTQLETRIGSTVNLLESIREDEVIGNTALPLNERAMKLKRYSDHFGYAIMGVTDEAINVHSSNDKPGNLSRRDFMQDLYANGTTQVTDVYTAGENGSLLIYTVAVPIMRDQKVVGSVWSSLKQDELIEAVVGGIREDSVNMVLLGTAGRVLCSSESGTYDMDLLELNQGSHIIGGDIREVETRMREKQPGSYYTFKDGTLWYVEYQNLAGTGWTIMYRGNILLGIAQDSGYFLLNLLLILLLGVLLELKLKRYMGKELHDIQDTLITMQDMQKKVQSGDEGMDYRELLDISSRGLVDSLTGLATRTMFGQQINGKVMMADKDKISLMCFVDLDDLKLLNDVYGHEAGDTALRNVGYTLRKYEKLYDGMAGRYGGDEFLLFLSDLPSEKNAEQILKQLVGELCSEIEVAGKKVQIHCSVGAAMYSRDANDANDLIIKADKALYDAKHRGKNTFSTYD